MATSTQRRRKKERGATVFVPLSPDEIDLISQAIGQEVVSSGTDTTRGRKLIELGERFMRYARKEQ